jgi:hypothetical protein
MGYDTSDMNYSSALSPRGLMECKDIHRDLSALTKYLSKFRFLQISFLEMKLLRPSTSSPPVMR